MRHEELFYLLALQNTEGIGDIVARKLLDTFGSAQAVLTAKSSEIRSVDGVGHIRIKNLKNKQIFSHAENGLRYIEKQQIRVTSYKDADYPERLRHCPDAPIVLFSRGNINHLQKRVLSIVGTRQVTPHGAEFCRKLISELAPLNPVIVSGFAYGVDIVAHQVAIENNLQTIGVLAHGLDQMYPKSHKKFAATVEANGGFITEFWSGSNPERENFVKRNRIVAGMSEATIVIESAEKGGSLITANIACDYNRDVFAVPGRPSDKYSIGCNNLIKSQKAHVLTQAADLVYMLNWDLETKTQPIQKKLFVSLDDDEQKIHDFISRTGKPLLDTISLECGFPIHKISSMLLNLELKGMIRPLPGKQFEAL